MLDDCLLPFTGTTGGAALLGLALLLIVGGTVLLLAVRRKRKNAALILVIPALLGALLLSGTPAPAYANGVTTDCPSPHPTATPTATSSPTPSPSATPSAPPTSPTPTPSEPTVPTPAPPVDPTADSDQDSLPDEAETRFGSDPKKADTDGDGLTDAQEVLTTTDPRQKDSDGNGVGDADEDVDSDELTNAVEIRLGTLPTTSDTDQDALSDSDEVRRGTDPLKDDTDDDGISDGDEVLLDADPLEADSNGNGIPDSEDSLTRTVADSSMGVTATLSGTGASAARASLAVDSSGRFDELPETITPVVDVHAPDGVTEGTVTFSFDPASVDADADLAIIHYDEATASFDLPENQEIDTSAGTATVTTTTFSPFTIIDVKKLAKQWQNIITLPRTGLGTVKSSILAALAIDSSGSMSWNDPDRLRVAAAQSFISGLTSNEFSDPSKPHDRAAVIDFDDDAVTLQPLTEELGDAKKAVELVDEDGGTNIGAGLSAALDQLPRNPRLDFALDGARSYSKVAILLTDGDGEYDPALTDRAKSESVRVYTVGLGAGTNVQLLQDIADGTQGKFFFVDQADGLKDAFQRIEEDQNKPDSDGDGISDETESKPWPACNGKMYTTKPDVKDSDGDGLSDGDEAGTVVSRSVKTKTGTYAWNCFASTSNPGATDTDNDGIDDYTEVSEGTLPHDPDSDHDGLNDLDETEFGSDPLSKNVDGDLYTTDAIEKRNGGDPNAYDMTATDNAGAFVAGYVLGDLEVPWVSPTYRSSVAYLVGEIASSFTPVVNVAGTARDFAAQLTRGDGVDWLALIPNFKAKKATAAWFNVAKNVDTTAKRVAKDPQSLASVARILQKELSVDDAKAAVEKIVRKAGVKLKQDAKVAGSVPGRASNGGDDIDLAVSKVETGALKIGKSEAQKKRLAELIRDRCRNEIRINQRQVSGTLGALKYAGINRPDLQCLDAAGNWYFAELDSKSSGRGLPHLGRILSNDPKVTSKQVDLITLD